MTGDGGLVEVQATAERTPLSRAHLDELLALAARRASRACARPRPRRDAGPRCASCSPPATPTSCASSAACCRTSSSSRCPTASSCRPRPATTFAENALDQGARGRARRPARRRSPTTRASRPRRSAAPPACAPPATPGRTRPTPRTCDKLRAEVPPGVGPALRLRDRLRRRRGEAPSGSFEGRCEGRMAEAPRGDGRLRLRPAVRPRRRRRHAARWPSSSDAEKDAISHRGRAARGLRHGSPAMTGARRRRTGPGLALARGRRSRSPRTPR